MSEDDKTALHGSQPQRRDCPHCGANCWDDDVTCWHCHRRPESPPVRPAFAQFSLGMVWLLLTVVAVSLGTIRWFPLLTVALAVWILPALAHTYLSCRILRTRVPAVDFTERLDRFGMALVWSLVAMFVALVCGILAVFLLQGIHQGLQRYFGLEMPASTGVRVVPIVMGLSAGGLVLWLTLPRSPPRDPAQISRDRPR